MDKKGFTLVELLAILLLLSVLTVLVISNVSAPLDVSNKLINNSKINVLLAAAKDYAEDNINHFALCTYNMSLSNPSSCIINEDMLLDGGYLEPEDVENLDSSYAVIACYNSDNMTITTFYKPLQNINCNDIEIHRLNLNPQVATVNYQEQTTLISSITTTGNFRSLSCDVSPDNQTWVTWASCSVSSDYKTLTIQFYGKSTFSYMNSQIMTVKVTGSYIDDNEKLQTITSNFRIVISK